MKTNLLNICLAATAALAQSSTLAKAKVPFDFIVGNQMLPAGQYTVDQGTNSFTVKIRSDDGKRTAFMLTNAVHSAVTRNLCRLGVPSLRGRVLSV